MSETSSQMCIPSFHQVKLLLRLLWLSRFSRVRFCATPQAAAHQAPPPLGFSRQERWSGLPVPSPNTPTNYLQDLPSTHILTNMWSCQPCEHLRSREYGVLLSFHSAHIIQRASWASWAKCLCKCTKVRYHLPTGPSGFFVPIRVFFTHAGTVPQMSHRHHLPRWACFLTPRVLMNWSSSRIFSNN